MAHAWWHTCITVGDPTGGAPKLKVPEGKRGNHMALFRIPHTWTEEEAKAKLARADEISLELVNLFRQPQESIVFNPIQGAPTALTDSEP